MGRECRTFLNPSAGLPPTRCVGESGVSKFGMLGFEPLQFIHQRVVLGVADLGRVHHVIEVLVTPQLRAQLLRPLAQDSRPSWLVRPWAGL